MNITESINNYNNASKIIKDKSEAFNAEIEELKYELNVKENIFNESISMYKRTKDASETNIVEQANKLLRQLYSISCKYFDIYDAVLFTADICIETDSYVGEDEIGLPLCATIKNIISVSDSSIEFGAKQYNADDFYYGTITIPIHYLTNMDDLSWFEKLCWEEAERREKEWKQRKEDADYQQYLKLKARFEK